MNSVCSSPPLFNQSNWPCTSETLNPQPNQPCALTSAVCLEIGAAIAQLQAGMVAVAWFHVRIRCHCHGVWEGFLHYTRGISPVAAQSGFPARTTVNSHRKKWQQQRKHQHHPTLGAHFIRNTALLLLFSLLMGRFSLLGDGKIISNFRNYTTNQLSYPSRVLATASRPSLEGYLADTFHKSVKLPLMMLLAQFVQ